MKYSLHLGYVSQHLIWSLIWEIFLRGRVSSNCPGAIDSLFHLIHREENQGGSMDSNCLGMRDFVETLQETWGCFKTLALAWKKDEEMCMLCPDPIEPQKNCRDRNLDHPNNLRYERIDKWREIVASCQGERLSPWRHTWLSCLAQGGFKVVPLLDLETINDGVFDYCVWMLLIFLILIFSAAVFAVLSQKFC